MASYTVSLLNPRVIADLELARHGLKVVNRPYANFLPTDDGRYLLTGGGNTEAEVAKFSNKDAAALSAYEAQLETIADLLRDLVLEAPPNLTAGGWRAAIPELLGAARLGNRLRKLTMDEKRTLLELFATSAGEFLDGWFDSAPLKAVLGFDGIVGNYASPYAAGSAYVLLHHVFGEVNGVKGAWGHAIGGMGAITQAMQRCCAERGVTIRTDTEVAEVLVERGRATGVVTAAGDTIRAARVVSNIHPRLLYERLIDADHLAPEFRHRIARWKSGSGTFRMNVALSALPSFTCKPGPGPHLSAGIILAPSLAYMEQAWIDARQHGWSKAPIVEMLIPSTLDDSLAPPGSHVASLFCQHVAPELPADFPGGSSWDDHRETVADLMIATVDKAAPGFAASVIGRQIKSPLDLERDFGLVGGDIFHGKLTLDQLFSARPMLGHADYRGPIAGRDMCGAGTHPGGGVTGAPGHNAARAILADRR